MVGTKPDPEDGDLDCEIIEQLREFLAALRFGTVDTYLSKLKAFAKKSGPPGAVPKSDLRGVSYHASGDWRVRMKLRDVFGKEKAANLPFTYQLEKDAGLAYDFAITYYCFVINQKMNHKLNSPAETLPMERRAELKCYVEEVLTNSFSFQVGKTLPTVPIIRGVDQGSTESWSIRLSVFGAADASFLFVPTTRFGSLLEASFAYDHLMPKVRQPTLCWI
jgi:hypothetical protein